MACKMMWRRSCFAIVSAAMVMTCLSAVVRADTYGFEGLTVNDVTNTAVAEAQLFVEVTDIGGGKVLFRFYNVGPTTSALTDVYFDDGTLLGIAYLIDADDNGGMAGVDFSQLASPRNLPAGQEADPDFQATTGFVADSDPPVQHNGVNPREEFGIVFDLQTGRGFNDVLHDLQTGELRIGIHVQGFPRGGSESLLNRPVAIPEPATLVLTGIGFALFSTARRRR